MGNTAEFFIRISVAYGFFNITYNKNFGIIDIKILK